MDEKEIILGIKNDQTESLEQLIELYKGYVVHIVCLVLGASASREDAMEVVSDVFYTIWKVRKRLDDSVSIKPYIATIARNMALKKIGSVKKHILLSDETVLRSLESPQQTVEQNEMFLLVREALNSLCQEDKEIFLRYYFLQQSVAEISNATDLKPSTVKTRLMRGRAKLKKLLKERGFDYE